MALGETCKICNESISKYKCPTCSIEYCSLKCFKSESHKHDEIKPEVVVKKTRPDNDSKSVTKTNDVFERLVTDEKLAYLLKFKALKFHLKTINDILNDPSLNSDQRWDLANAKLSSLRITGSEENELIEEFCQRVIELQTNT